MIGADGVEQAASQRVPHRVDVVALAQRRLSHPQRRVRALESVERQIEVQRSRLAEHAQPARFRVGQGRESDARREMHEVEGDAGLRGELRRGADRDVLGLGWTALREVAHAVVAGGVQRGGGARDDGVVLGVHSHEHPRGRGGAEKSDVVGDPLVEARRDHEHLEPGVSVARQRGKLADHRVARVGDDDVEGVVRERHGGVAQTALDAGAERPLLVDHRAHRRHTASDRGPSAVREVIERRDGRRAREVRVQIDAARQHERSRGVDIACRTRDVADRGDPSIPHAHVGARAAAGRHDRSPADRQVDQSASSSRLARRSASSCSASASIRSSMSPSMRRSRFDRL